MMAEDENRNSDTVLLVATFIIDNACFGIDANQVQEVVQVRKFTTVHHAPAFITGVMNLRGKVITIIDLGEKLAFGEIERNDLNRILIVEWKNEYIGLLVDKIAEVINVETKDIHDAPGNVHGVMDLFIAGVFQNSAGQLVGLLDIGKILDAEDLTMNEMKSMDNK